MAIRNKAPREDFDDGEDVLGARATVWNADGTAKMLVKIDGLTQVGADNLFELSGVRPREVDWALVKADLGFGGEDMPEALCERISDAVWDHDIREVLAQRIKRTTR